VQSPASLLRRTADSVAVLEARAEKEEEVYWSVVQSLEQRVGGLEKEIDGVQADTENDKDFIRKRLAQLDKDVDELKKAKLAVWQDPAARQRPDTTSASFLQSPDASFAESPTKALLQRLQSPSRAEERATPRSQERATPRSPENNGGRLGGGFQPFRPPRQTHTTTTRQAAQRIFTHRRARRGKRLRHATRCASGEPGSSEVAQRWHHLWPGAFPRRARTRTVACKR
jgi:hypothetical protein